MLACLARRANTVVSKAEILDEVWDAAYDGDLNIIEVHIRALRRSIDVPFAVQSIEPVRGVGYRWRTASRSPCMSACPPSEPARSWSTPLDLTPPCEISSGHKRLLIAMIG